MWLRSALLSGGLFGCSQFVGIHDISGTNEPPSDAVEPPPRDTTPPGDSLATCAPVASFGVATNFGAAGAFGMAGGDLDNDGHLDVIYVDGTGAKLLKGTGNPGGLGAATAFAGSTNSSGVAIADLDNNGLADVITWDGQSLASPGTNTVRAHRQQVGGGFAAAQSFTVPGSPATRILDVKIARKLDGDAFADLVISTNTGTLPYLSNAGNGTFTAGTAVSNLSSVTLAVTDLDGDGFDDVAYATNAGMQVLFNKTATPGTFDPVVTIGSGDVTNAAIGRFSTNAPRKDVVLYRPGLLGLPLFVQNSPRAFTQADPMAIFQIFATAVSSGAGAPLQVLDLNGDGKDDVIGDGTYAVQCATGTFYPGDGDPPLMFDDVPGTSKGAPLFLDLDDNSKPDILQIIDGLIKVRHQ